MDFLIILGVVFVVLLIAIVLVSAILASVVMCLMAESRAITRGVVVFWVLSVVSGCALAAYLVQVAS